MGAGRGGHWGWKSGHSVIVPTIKKFKKRKTKKSSEYEDYIKNSNNSTANAQQPDKNEQSNGIAIDPKKYLN